MDKYEYKEGSPASWQPFEPPPFDSAFQRELEIIAGKTNDKPNLRLVWAGNLKDDRTEHQNQLKYHIGYTVPKTIGFNYIENGETFFTDDIDTIPAHILGVTPVIKSQALGLPRWVIERYTSPDTLKKLNRFTNRKNDDDFTVLRDFPREGIYETWLILDTKENMYREPGGDLLPFIRHKWQFEQLPQKEQLAKYEKWQEKQEHEKALRKQEAWEWAMDGGTKLPYEERARREFLENKVKEDLEREMHDQATVAVYQSTK